MSYFLVAALPAVAIGVALAICVGRVALGLVVLAEDLDDGSWR